MITTLLVALALQAGHFYQTTDPNASEIAIEAVVAIKDDSDYGQAVARTLALSLKGRTTTYSIKDIQTVTNGQPIQAEFMPDHIRIGLSVPPGNLRAGLSLMESLLKEASLSDDRINQVKSQVIRESNPWDQTLFGTRADLSCVINDDVRSAYHELCTPNNVWIGVAGTQEKDQAAQQWQTRVELWPEIVPKPKYKSNPKVRFRDNSTLTTLEFRSGLISAGDVDLPARLLALIALGGGKGSDLFEICRRQHAWSYRQEAFVWPNSKGWEPRILMAISSDGGPTQETVLEELRKAVNKWSEDDRKRAVGFAQSVFRRGLEFSPLYFTNNGPPNSTLEDRAFLIAYWPMKTGRAWNSEHLLASIALVNLDDLREAGKGLLANPHP